MRVQGLRFLAIALAVGLGATLGASPSFSQAGGSGDDTALFSATVPPNVLFAFDNSGSMRNITWHPAFDPDTTYSCNPGTGGYTGRGSWSTDQFNRTRCGTTRNYYIDPLLSAQGERTEYSAEYLNWIHSLNPALPAEATILAELAGQNNGTYSTCVQAALGLTTYHKYRRSRITVNVDVARELVCSLSQSGGIRVGLAFFRKAGGDGDSNGGFVRIPVDDLTPTHTAALYQALNDIQDPNRWGSTGTPLAEFLFQSYTYFMSRTNLPGGATSGTFPSYSYATNWPNPANGSDQGGSYTTNSAAIPPDPVQYECQKHFVILMSDGSPNDDQFYTSGNDGSENTARGFGNYANLIGDFDGDGTGHTTQEGLPDVALFMHTQDMRPDFNDPITVDVYTVGFSTDATTGALLLKTAQNGGGEFKQANSAEQLTSALIAALASIQQKAQGFAAATVPATRTADGGNLYTSFFTPQQNDPYWLGHLQLWKLTKDGEVLGQGDVCAFQGNPVPCTAGAFNPSVQAYWDAGEEIPAPASRNLLVSVPGLRTVATSPPASLPEFLHTTDGGVVNAGNLGDPFSAVDDLAFADVANYSGSNAANGEELAEEIVGNVRGCEFGTGANGTGCVERPWLLGDIFHSNPVAVGNPKGFVNEPEYIQFRQRYQQRDVMVYAGSNDGWLHGFHSGDFQTSPPAPTPGYDRGTGTEVFGFMPWPARQNIRELPRDNGARDYYFVDGSPSAADAWLDFNGNELKSVGEWRTVLLGGLRQGGRAYYALDVTNPDNAYAGPGAPDYPGYLWEFPAEDDPQALKDEIGETWGRPIITKVKMTVAGVARERWVAIVTGGYAEEGDPNSGFYDPNSITGRGIYILDLLTGQILAEKKFIAGDPGPQGDMLYAIAATPAIFDIDADGYSDVIFVGDLGGNMWKWVIRYEPNLPSPLIPNALDDGPVDQPNTRFRKFFEATDTPGTLGVSVGGVDYYKSFFFPPQAVLKGGKLWLAFGSGERADLKRLGDNGTTAENNRFYIVTDTNFYDRSASSLPGNPLSELDLFDSSATAAVSTNCIPITGTRGYFFRGDDGEKFVTNVAIFNFWVIAGSYTPTVAPVTPCSASGVGAIYIFKIYCGDGYFADTGAHADRKLSVGTSIPTDPSISTGPGGTEVIATRRPGRGAPGAR